jgi:excisionase family DNA binding protein
MPAHSRHPMTAATANLSPSNPRATANNSDACSRPLHESESSRRTAPDPLPATVWLSGKDAANYVGVSWPTLRQFILNYGVPHVRLGTRWKIERTVLDESLRRVAEMRPAQ